jgi:methylenetetrahydrofolate reductase (NADPH)
MSQLPQFSFEFFPPRTVQGSQNLIKTTEHLNKFNPEFFSVTFGAGGSTKEKTIETVLDIKKTGAIAVPHVSCISSTKEEIKSLLDEYQSNDIKRIVALRGDNPSGVVSYGDFQYAEDLVKFIRDESGDFFEIEVAAYPEFHPESASVKNDIVNFKKKVDAGANGAITQFFFSVDAYFKFIEDCQKNSINIPIVPGVMPIYNIKQLSRFAASCGTEIPRWLRMRLEGYEEDLDSLRSFGVDIISEMCETLVQYEVPGIHFYTLNKSAIITRIIDNLQN